MAAAAGMSPGRYSAEMDYLYNGDYTAEMSAKMQVPKKIQVGGGGNDDDISAADEMVINPWQPDKIDMRVPDRILLLGHNQHVGAEAPPRELQVENTIMPPDPGLIRVQTPPRVITLDEHYFPTAVDELYERDSRPLQKLQEPLTELQCDSRGYKPNQTFQMDNTMMEYSVSQEEVVHLRRQLAKLNRRVMNVEREMASRQQRDFLVWGFASVYLVFKLLSWMQGPRH